MKHFNKKNELLIIIAMVISIMVIPVAGLYAQDSKPVVELNGTAEAIQTAAAIQEERPTADFSAAFLSQYIWRGYELSRNSIVVQPSITVAYKGFSANLWGNLDSKPYFSGAGDASYSSAMNETDFTLSYTKTLGLLNVGGGFIYYALAPLNKDMPDRADSQELFATVGMNTMLSPSLTVYKDIAHYRHWYVLFGVSHIFELSDLVSLKLAATTSYLYSNYADAALFNAGAGYGGYPKFDGNSVATNEKFNNFHDGNVTISLPIKATKYITFTPTISFIFPLSDEAKNEMKGQGMKGAPSATERDSSFIVGGLVASFTF